MAERQATKRKRAGGEGQDQEATQSARGKHKRKKPGRPVLLHYFDSTSLETLLLGADGLGISLPIPDLIHVVLEYMMPCESSDLCEQHLVCNLCREVVCPDNTLQCEQAFDSAFDCTEQVHIQCTSQSCKRCVKCVFHSSTTKHPCHHCKKGCVGCVKRCRVCLEWHCVPCMKRCGRQQCGGCLDGSWAAPIGVSPCASCMIAACSGCVVECESFDCTQEGCNVCMLTCEKCEHAHCEECDCVVRSE
jgi:hypothetical protein